MTRLARFITIIALVAMAICIPAGIKYGIEKSEVSECKTWANQAKEYPGFYLTDWQKSQCRHYGIEVTLSAPQNVTKDWQNGTASWYDYDLGGLDQKCTKEKEPCYSQRADTCASRDYPRGTILHVATTDKAITCRVNDYGPADRTRIIDLSSHAFAQLAPLSKGLIEVTVQELKNNKKNDENLSN